MPILGVGPIYAILTALLTIIICLLDWHGVMPSLHLQATDILFRIISVVCLVAAAALWSNAVLIKKIDKHIRQNQLVTSGAYAWVRNPIYSAIMLVMWGVLFWTGNLYLMLFCPLYPILMTALLKHTEEKWLSKMYGQIYFDYCKRVNRCIPWFPKK